MELELSGKSGKKLPIDEELFLINLMLALISFITGADIEKSFLWVAPLFDK